MSENKEFCGRKVSEGRTVRNGILNPFPCRWVGGVEKPNPYWAVMDAMSVPDEFTKSDVVHGAMEVLRQYGYKTRLGRSGVNVGKPSQDVLLERACSTAWYVLKRHQSHPGHRGKGYPFIVERVGKGKFILRERRTEEYVVKKGDKPLRTVVLHSI